MSEGPQFTFNSSGFLVFLNKYRNIFLLVGLAAILLSWFFSSPLFITPKFQSTVIMFPTSTNSVSKALLSNTYGNKQDILEFGDEEQAEQLLQILNSNLIRNRVISTFKLMSHYKIDSNGKYKMTKLYRQYDNNITFRRTEYMAVQISVLDHDPQMAADIANTIADLVDSTKNQMIRERAMEGYKIVEQEYMERTANMIKLQDSMTVLRKLGVQDYETQAEQLNRQLAIEVARGNNAGIKALEERLAIIAQYGGAYVALRDALENEEKEMSMLKSKFAEAKVDARQALPQKFIVNNAYKAEKKTYPVRWLIVFISLVSSLLLTTLVVIAMENYPGKDDIQKKNL
jgi:capsular polysaccharide biosynthesis protein